MDQTDRKILQLLQENAKLNIKEIAARVNMTKTPVYERIKRLEKNGVIKKYVAITDKSKAPASMVVFCSVTLEVQKLEQIQQFSEAITKIPEVMECYLLGGANDFLIKVLVKDLAAYHQFSSGKLASLPHVSQIKSSFVLDEIKYSTAVPFMEE